MAQEEQTALTDAVRVAVTALERQSHLAGWDTAPALYALVDQSAQGGDPTVDAVVVPIDASLWREHDPAVAGRQLPHWIGLQIVTDLVLLDPTWLPDEMDQQAEIIGFAFGHIEMDPSALDDDPRAVPTPTRMVTGYDVNGCVYEIVRARGSAVPAVTVLTDPAPHQRDVLITVCLQRLVSHVRDRDDASESC